MDRGERQWPQARHLGEDLARRVAIMGAGASLAFNLAVVGQLAEGLNPCDEVIGNPASYTTAPVCHAAEIVMGKVAHIVVPRSAPPLR